MKFFGVLGATIAIAVLCVSCGNSNNENPEGESLQIPTTSVYKSNIVSQLNYVANVQASQNVEIRARVEGYLEAILVDEGKQVKKGQLLFKINDEEYAAELTRAKAARISAEAEFKAAKVELERVKLLVEKNVIAKTDLDLANAKMEIANAKIEQAKAEEIAANIKLQNTQIKSPFDGIIDRIPYKIGSLISEGTLLTTISDLEGVFVYFKVSEVEYLKYFKNLKDTVLSNKVELILADGVKYPLKGKIETMESEFEENTGAIALRAKFPNPDYLLKHGSTGRIIINEVLKNVLLVHQKSVVEYQDKNYVFLLDKNNMVTLKSINISQRFKDYYILDDGLEENQKIVYEGTQSIRDGSVIKPKFIQPKEIFIL